MRAEHPAPRAALATGPRRSSFQLPMDGGRSQSSPPPPAPRRTPPSCHPRAWKNAAATPREGPKPPPKPLPPPPAPLPDAIPQSLAPKIPLAQAFPTAVLAPPHAAPPGWGHVPPAMPPCREAGRADAANLFIARGSLWQSSRCRRGLRHGADTPRPPQAAFGGAGGGTLPADACGGLQPGWHARPQTRAPAPSARSHASFGKQRGLQRPPRGQRRLRGTHQERGHPPGKGGLFTIP